MRYWTSKAFPIMLTLVVFVTGAALMAQERGERGPRGDRGPRGGEQVDREQMRERMEERRAAMSERMREQLGLSAEEWTVIEPRIQQVQTLQAQGSVGGRGMMGMRGRGGRGFGPGGGDEAGEGEARELPPVAQASRDLRQTLADEDASEAQINERLVALRAARAEHAEELDEAREALRELLTPRQEAVLVMTGVLD
ncbi:MAG: hypothetical protein WDZ31_06875 [Phycisphaeraceae bacterium]